MTNSPNRVSGAMVGLSGFIPRHHLVGLRGILSPQVNIEACVPGDPEHFEENRALAISLGFDGDRVYRTPEELVAKEKGRIQFGVGARPNFLHESDFRPFAEAHLGFISDKPLAHTLESANAMADLAVRHGVATCVTPTYCGHPPNIEARHRILGGGRAPNILGGLFRYPQGWLKKKQAAMTSGEGAKQAKWRRDPEQAGAGGATGDLVSHLVHQLLFFTGLRVMHAWARRRWMIEGAGGTTDDKIVGGVRLENGAEIEVHSVQFAGGHANDNTWELWLKDGVSYGWSMNDPEILWTTENGRTERLNRGDFQSPLLPATHTMPPDHDDGWAKANGRLCQSFLWDTLSCVPAGATPFHPDFLVGRNVVAVLDAMIRSSVNRPEGQDVAVNWRSF